MMETDQVRIEKTVHEYDSCFRADQLRVFLTGAKCRELGLFLLAAGLGEREHAVELRLTHPESQIQRLRIRENSLRDDELPQGIVEAVVALNYWPDETRKHPWLDDCNVHGLPVFQLSNHDDCVGPRAEDWEARDTIWMPVGYGTIRFAELLLNAGCRWNPVREYQLEGDGGFRGVGVRSAEMRIFLPGWWENEIKEEFA
jgi:hypothetical protein